MTIETLLLAFALCVDAFLAAFSYGAGRIQIPFYSAAVIAVMGTTVLGIALWAAALAQPLLPPGLAKWAGVSLLLFIGLWNLFQNSIKGFLKRLGGGTQFSFHWGGVGFVLDVYMDETLADADLSQVLTAREALYLAAALSLDSLVSGFGAGLDLRHPGILLCCTFFLHLAAVGGGCALGRKLAHRQELNISWLGGAMLILLALLRLA